MVAAQGEASAADVPWRTLRDDFADVPLLRLVLSDPDDLVPASMQPWVCQAAGHRPHDDCSLHCETFALWRPRARLWAAMRPALTRLDAWGGGAVGVVARTGAADHFDELPHALDPPGGVETASVLTARLAALFLPCRNSSALALRRRERRPGDAPCVTYDDDDRAEGRHAGASAEPTVASLSGCGPETEVATALASTAPGPLGLFLSCAARAAASLALRRSFAREAPLGHGGVPGAGDWGVLLFSDAPGLKCALEAGPASPRHAAVTPTVPGHTAYAPRRLHHRVLLAALADMYLLGLVDWDLPLTRSAFINAARQRRMLPALPPPPWARPNVPPPLSAGYERFFEAGRERSKGGAGVDFGVLSLLGRTNARCELTRAAVARAQLARLATAHPDELAADDHAAAAHE